MCMDKLRFATIKHDRQRRKGVDLPYIVHPIDVYLILKSCGYPDDFAELGLLHDVLEDTKTAEEELRGLYGDDVTDMIKSVSNNFNGGKFDYRNAPIRELILKTADTISNTEDYIKYPKKGVSKTKFDEYIEKLKISKDRLDPMLDHLIIERIDSILRTLL